MAGTGHPSAVGQLSARRFWINRVTRWVVAAGGAAVIGAITLIFAYLLWVVGPIFVPGEVSQGPSFPVVDREPVLVDVSENGEVLLRVSDTGLVEFYSSETGVPVAAFNLGIKVQRAQRVYPLVDTYALVTDQRSVLVMQALFIVDFVDGERKLTPRVEFPFGTSPIALGGQDVPDAIDVYFNDSVLVIASAAGTNLSLTRYRGAESGTRLRRPQSVTLTLEEPVERLLIGPRNQWIYAVTSAGVIDVLSINNFNRVQRLYRGSLVAPGEDMTAVMGVLGRYSLIAASDAGYLTQWGLLNDAAGTRLEVLREFKLDQPAQRLVPEPRRKGFASVAADGTVTLLYPTSARVIDSLNTELPPDVPLAISPRSNVLIAAPSGQTLALLELDNKHPEISLGTLWGKIWYEGYEEPIFSWQSSSADNDFEPKFSLTPLAFGTLKAAFYALLFAVPIAIMGALYTAYFMAPAMRAWVKPGIEIMAALPTVILGFIGGLWLAPIIESNLASVLTVIVLLPVCLFAFALLWSRLPDKMTRVFEGWYGLIATPLVIGIVLLAFSSGPLFEAQFFGGDAREWFREVMGLSYDQRNALVVGIIMGLAVIPNIFSIAEDAIYGVPTHLINGSLALGATPWQTLVRVVLLTASPGIFSAVMIGLGRAVGETMIVLMATGNTPLMDFNIFEGMRTFAANIAVELPESEVNSSHYRILFLAALVLFMLTFVFNTFAEVVRQRLRARYGSL